MNKEFFNLNILEDNEIYDSGEYGEFSICLESLSVLLLDELFTEAVKGNPKGVVGAIKDAAGKAQKGTSGALDVYGDLTDAGGALMDSIYQLSINSLRLITKILKFIATNISKIPLALAKVIKNLTKLPENIVNKIKGSIELYITIKDLPVLQDEIMMYIDDFLTLATSFTADGDYKGSRIFSFKEDDFKIYDRMNILYKRVQNVKFEKTSVLLNDKEVVATYLSPKSKYYKGMNKVIDMMNDNSPKFEKLVTLADGKFNANQIRGVVSKLSPTDQLKAKKSIQVITKMIEITGNIIKYVIADIATIDKTLVTIMKHDKKNLMKDK